jgi:hypothetical protein
MDDPDPDPASFRLGDDPPLPPRQRRAQKSVEPYLRGPIAWAWLRKADTAGAAALLVGLALWHHRALRKRTEYPISLREICRLTAQSPKTARRGLAALEAAGLINRATAPGRKPHVALQG